MSKAATSTPYFVESEAFCGVSCAVYRFDEAEF